MQAETNRIDELLECLVFLTRFYGVPNSKDALTTGLPLVSGLLTPNLFGRAAERGGLSAREVIQPLAEISPCCCLACCRCAMAAPAFCWSGMKTGVKERSSFLRREMRPSGSVRPSWVMSIWVDCFSSKAVQVR